MSGVAKGNKVRELASKLMACNSGKVNSLNLQDIDRAERIIRAELEGLLETIKRVTVTHCVEPCCITCTVHWLRMIAKEWQ